MERRRFIQTAASLPALPLASSSSATADDDQADGDDADSEPDRTLFAAFDTCRSDFEATYSVKSFPGDPNSDVGLSIGMEFGHVGIEMKREKAERLADELRRAAREGDS